MEANFVEELSLLLLLQCTTIQKLNIVKLDMSHIYTSCFSFLETMDRIYHVKGPFPTNWLPWIFGLTCNKEQWSPKQDNRWRLGWNISLKNERECPIFLPITLAKTFSMPHIRWPSKYRHTSNCWTSFNCCKILFLYCKTSQMKIERQKLILNSMIKKLWSRLGSLSLSICILNCIMTMQKNHVVPMAR